MKHDILYIVFLLVSVSVFGNGYREFDNPQILSFERGTTPAKALCGSRLSVSTSHYKHGAQSLCWQWHRRGAALCIPGTIPYERVKTVNTDNSMYSFSFWLYNPAAVDDSLQVDFLKAGRVCCRFAMCLNFTGWRAGWLAFDRDMQDTPEEGMDEVRFTAPRSMKRGTLFIDHLVTCSLIDCRHHQADAQLPFVNAGNTNMWIALYRNWTDTFDIPLKSATPEEQQQMEILDQRVHEYLLPSKAEDIIGLRERFAAYRLTQTAGRPVFFERFGELYTYWDERTYGYWMADLGIRETNTLLKDLAVAYHRYTDKADKEEAKHMYLRLLKHAMDQGFQAGHSMGTLHHSGYSMKDWYTSAFLMRNVLREEGLLEQVQQSMAWFSGVGELKHAPVTIGVDIDAFNTNTMPRLTSILLMQDDAQRLRYMTAFRRWLDNGLAYAPGLMGTFKVDGTIYHHCNHYPAYAKDGLNGIVPLVYLLRGTQFLPSEEGLSHLRESMLAMRYYCQLTKWPVSLSGRHPDGKGQLVPRLYALMALTGTTEGTIDQEMAAAYLRLMEGKETSYSQQFEKMGIRAEKTPQGNRAFPYSCLTVHRSNNRMVAVKGHSRYIWNTETYMGCNLYGRYLNYGNIHILSGDNSYGGYQVDGWDWNHFPGTTATVVPVADLRADIRNVSDVSGYEELLLSDEAFCNGLSLNGNGIWGMKLHSHDKYDGSLHARKSVFCFGDRIVCLGSDIRSAAPTETHTTLFQVHCDSTTTNYQLPTTNYQSFPDGYGNWYYPAPGQELIHRAGLQHSFHEETDAPTEGYFELLAVNHGIAPSDATYAYAIYIGEGEPLTEQQMHDSYTVLQQDSIAHIVRDNVSGMTGYVLFETGSVLDNNRSCLVMTQPVDSGLLVCVSDPDLHLYEGDKEQYDNQGHRVEQIVYATDWKDNPSAPSVVRFTIPGYPPVEVTCQDGMGQTLLLKNINK